MIPFQAVTGWIQPVCEGLTEENARGASLEGEEAKFQTQGGSLQWKEFAEGIFRKRDEKAQR